MDNEIPTGGKLYSIMIGDDGEGHFAVTVMFEGFDSREEAQAYADLLNKHEIFNDSEMTLQ